MRPSVKVGGREKNKNNAGKSEQFLCFGQESVSMTLSAKVTQSEISLSS